MWPHKVILKDQVVRTRHFMGRQSLQEQAFKRQCHMVAAITDIYTHIVKYNRKCVPQRRLTPNNSREAPFTEKDLEHDAYLQIE